MVPGSPAQSARAQLLRALQHAVTATGVVDPVAVSRLVVDHLRDHLGADAASIAVWALDGSGARVLAHNSPNLADPTPPIVAGQGALDLAYSTGQVIVVEDYGTWPRADRRAITRGVASCAAVPLLVGGQAIGALALESYTRRRFDSAETQWLAMIAAQVGLLVRTAHLHQEADRQRTELARSERRLRSIYEGIACGIVVRDVEGTIVHVNAIAEEILGVPAVNLIGHRSVGPHPALTERGSVLAPADWPDLIAMRTGQAVRNVTLGIDRPSGGRRWLQVSAIPLPGSDDQPVEAVLSFVDITSRKDTESQLRNLAQTEKLRAIGQMAGGIAHDINQYLGLITGHGDLALRSLDQVNSDLDRLRQSIQTIIQAATDGSATVNRLLTFARPRAGATHRQVELGSLLAEVAELTAPRWRDAVQAEGHPVTFDIAVEGDTTVDGSPESLREALTNLVFNAVDAMPRGGEIRLSARRKGNTVGVDVSDTGIGIDEDVRAHIFEPFFTTKGERGSGLGLPVVFAIVEQHHGHIAIDSTPGQGTTFHLTFPASAAEASAPRSPDPLAEPPSLRILAVDDEVTLAKMIGLMLKSEGHVVEVAASGEEALQRLQDQTFDLVISDVGMGQGMSGWQLAEAVRERYPGMRFCLSTGWGAHVDLDQARARGVDAVISKPYRLTDLKRILTFP